MQDYKIYAALAYARENKLNRTTIDAARMPSWASSPPANPTWTCSKRWKNWASTEENGAQMSASACSRSSMPWPLEPDGVREFAQGLDEILVVEEKRQIVEYQLKEQLYNWRDDVRPRVIGKFDEKGEWVAPARRMAADRPKPTSPYRADRASDRLSRIKRADLRPYHLRP